MKSSVSLRNLTLAAVCAAGVGTAVFLAGCGSDSDAANPNAPSAVTSSGPPTLSELAAAVSLTEPQSTEITPPLERWHTRDTQMRQARRAGNVQRDENFEPPMMGFLEDSAPILDHGQFLAMVSYLDQRRDQAREQWAAGRAQAGDARPGRGMHRGQPGDGGDGPGLRAGGPGGFMIMRLIRELDLDAATVAQVRAAAKPYLETLQGLRKQNHDGGLTDEAFRDQAKAARVAFESALSGILGAENYAKYEQLKAEQRTEFATRALEKVGDGIDRRVAFLTKVLDLDDTQAASVRKILEDEVPARQALITSLRDGGMEMEDFLYASKQLRDATRQAMEGVLTSDQLETLDALDELMPGRGHGHGPGPGPGGRG